MDIFANKDKSSYKSPSKFHSIMRKLFSIITTLAISLVSCSTQNAKGVGSGHEASMSVDVPLSAHSDVSESASEPENVQTDSGPILFTNDEREAIARQNDFALSVYKELYRSDNENMLFSPLSLSISLSMLANGAAGTTLRELEKMTGMNKRFGLEDLNQLSRKLISGLGCADRQTEISLANSLWVDKDYDVASGYVRDLKKYYSASVFRCNLHTDTAIYAINSWISEKTDGLIPDFLKEPLNESVRMTLCNAMHFKGNWKEPFLITRKGKFICSDNREVEIDMLSGTTSNLTVSEDEMMTDVYLDFGDGEYFMECILPAKGHTLSRIVNALNNETLDRLSSGKREDYRNLIIPKFKSEQRFYLRKILEKLGYGNIFSPTSDFSRINPSRELSVDNILQGTCYSIDKWGAEGAAVTIEFMETSNGYEPQNLVFDRPFIYLVREKSTGAILFVGDVKKL